MALPSTSGCGGWQLPSSIIFQESLKITYLRAVSHPLIFRHSCLGSLESLVFDAILCCDIAVSPRFAGSLPGNSNLSVVGEKEVFMLRWEIEKKTYPDHIVFCLDSLGYHSCPSVNPICDQDGSDWRSNFCSQRVLGSRVYSHFISERTKTQALDFGVKFTQFSKCTEAPTTSLSDVFVILFKAHIPKLF